jgi:hypothetical protein
MKKILFILLLAVGVSGISTNDCSAKLSTGEKIALGCGLAGVGAIGLLYYYAKLRKKEDKNFFENVAPFVSGAALVGGGIYAGYQGYYVDDGDEDEIELTPGVPLKDKNVKKDDGSVDFFPTVFGMSREDWKKLNRGEKGDIFKSLEDNGVSTGKFASHEIGRKLVGQGVAVHDKKVTFVFKSYIDGKPGNHSQYTSLAELRALPEYNKALFQVFTDWTCAPSIREFPGSMLAAGYRRAQINPVDTNLFHGLVRGGHIGLDKDADGKSFISRFNRVPKQDDDEWWKDIGIGFHSDISVTHDENDENIISQDQRIHHAVCCAVPDLTKSNISDMNRTQYKNILRVFLRSAYLGTLLLAAAAKIKRVVLTIPKGADKALMSRQLEMALSHAPKIGVGDITVFCDFDESEAAANGVHNTARMSDDDYSARHLTS